MNNVTKAHGLVLCLCWSYSKES